MEGVRYESSDFEIWKKGFCLIRKDIDSSLCYKKNSSFYENSRSLSRAYKEAGKACKTADKAIEKMLKSS